MGEMSTLSGASCCAQFVDYASLMISGSPEICKSPDGQLIDYSHLEGVASRLLVLSNDIQLPDGGSLTPWAEPVGHRLRELYEECSNISGQLLSALIMLQFHGRTGKWTSVRHALRSQWNQKEIDVMQKKLENLRRRLVVEILEALRYAMISPPASSAEKPGDSMPNSVPTICSELLKGIDNKKRWQEDLLAEVHRSHAKGDRNDLRETFAAITRSSSKPKPHDFAAFILTKLRFPEMDERYERIAKAHPNTFDWIYNEPSIDFANWLQNESTQYWISGHPGSGKSTLMKFVREDQRTKDCLIKWATPKKLVTAAFFFWKSGTTMQVSQTGLLQSLLFEVLTQCPDLATCVFPAHWEAYVLFGGTLNDHWSEKELERAFKRLIQEASSTVKFCFWIDGIDEFRGDPLRLNRLLAKSFCAPCQVKLCVSSRPWVVFEDAFGTGRKISLQDLTRPDIHQFVTSRLSTNPIFDQMQRREPHFASELRDGIVVKSSGIFLWVELVLRSLLAGLTYGDRISDLKRRLDSLPPELDDLILKILDSLDSFYFEQAAQLFQIVSASLTPPTLLSLYLADGEKPASDSQREKGMLTDEEMKFRVETMRRRVTSRCKGLLEMTPNSQALVKRPNPDTAKRARLKEDVLLTNLKVKYLHRTVQDLLERADNWEKFTTATGKAFSPNEALCKSFILQLRVLHPRYLMPHSFWQIIGFCVEHYARAERESGTTQVEVLDELDEAATAWSQLQGPFGYTFVHFFWRTEAGTKYHWTSTLATDWSHSVGGPAASTFLNFAARCQLHSYVQAKLNDGYSSLASSLLYTAVNDYRISLPNAPSCQLTRPNIKLIELLLAHKADTNAQFSGISTWERVLEQGANASTEDRTLWHGIQNLFIRYGADMEKAPYLKEIRHQRNPIFFRNPFRDSQQPSVQQYRESSISSYAAPPTPTSQTSPQTHVAPSRHSTRFSNASSISGYNYTAYHSPSATSMSTSTPMSTPAPISTSVSILIPAPSFNPPTVSMSSNGQASPLLIPLPLDVSRGKVEKRIRMRIRKPPGGSQQQQHEYQRS